MAEPPTHEPDNPTEAIPANEAFDNEAFEVWWPKYLERVDESVIKAEEYLEVPTGTISSIPAWEPVRRPH